MKKSLQGILLLGAVCGFAAENLLVNPGFERLTAKGGICGWYPSAQDNCERVKLDDAGYGLRLAGPSRRYWMQPQIKVVPGRDYIITVRANADKGTDFDIYVESNKPVFRTFHGGVRKGSGAWENVKLEFKYPSFENPPYLVLRQRGAGRVVFANPVLVPAPGVFQNGSFDRNGQGWLFSGGAAVIPAWGASGPALRLYAPAKDRAPRAVQKNLRVEKGVKYLISYDVAGSSRPELTDTMKATWFRVAPFAAGKPVPGTEAFLDCFEARHHKKVVFTAPDSGLIDLVCEVRAPGEVRIDNIRLEKSAAGVPALEWVLAPPASYRAGKYQSQPYETLSGRLLVSVPGGHTLELGFAGKQKKLDVRGDEVPFSFAVPGAAGRYPLTARLFSGAGKLLAESSLDFTVRPAAAGREVVFDRNLVLRVDGKPFFPLVAWGAHGAKRIDEKAADFARAGFNIWSTTTDNLDLAQANGMFLMARICETFPAYVRKNPAKLAEWKKRYATAFRGLSGHPALIGYFISDEPAWRGIAPEGIIEAYQFIRELDPYKPIGLNEAPRGRVESLRRYDGAFDIYGVDIYPVPGPNSHSGLDDKMMTSVGRYTDICREVVRARKPVWMTLQGFSWGVLTGKASRGGYPTHEENRFMAYNTLLHGATGLMYYGINEKKDNPEFLTLLGRTIHEVRSLGAVLTTAPVPANVRCDRPSIRLMRRNWNGTNYYFAINESGVPVRAVFTGAFPEKLHVLFEKRFVATDRKAFSDDFRAYDVHVYAERAELPPDLTAHHLTKIRAERRPDDDGFYRSAKWIWYPGRNTVAGHRTFFRREITLTKPLKQAVAAVTADDTYRLRINGRLTGEPGALHGGWALLDAYDLTGYFKPGRNVIEVEAWDAGQAPCGFFAAFRFTGADGSCEIVATDRRFQAAEKTDGPYVAAGEICAFGQGPWGDRMRLTAAEDKVFQKKGF